MSGPSIKNDIATGIVLLGSLAGATLPAVPANGQQIDPPAKVKSIDSEGRLDAELPAKLLESLDKLDARMNDESLKPLVPSWQKQRDAMTALAQAGARVAKGETGPEVVVAYKAAFRQSEETLQAWDIGTAGILKDKNLPPAPPKQKEERKSMPEREFSRADLKKQADTVAIYLETMKEYADRNKDSLGDSHKAWEKTAKSVGAMVDSTRETLRFPPGKNDKALLEVHGLALESAFAGIGGAGELFKLALASKAKQEGGNGPGLPARIVVVDELRFNQQKMELVFGATMAKQGLGMLGDKAPPGLDKAIDSIREGALKAKNPEELTGVLLKQLELFNGMSKLGGNDPLSKFTDLVRGGAGAKAQAGPVAADLQSWITYYDKNIGFRLNVQGRSAAVGRFLSTPEGFEQIQKGSAAMAAELNDRWKGKEMPAGTKAVVEQLSQIALAKSRDDLKLNGGEIRAALDFGTAAVKAPRK